MLACARLGAVHSVVFGGFAPHELAVRIDDVRPTVVVTASCGIEPTRIVEYKPMLDARDRDGRSTRRGIALWCNAIGTAATLVDGPRSGLARADGDRCSPSTRCRWRPPIRSTCSTRPAPPASPRASSATTAGMRWRCCGPCATSTTSAPATCSGRPPMSAGWSATPTSSTRRCWSGATTVLYEGKPVGTPDPGAFWRVISEHGVKALFTAPTAIRAIRKEDPEATYMARYDLSGAEVSVRGR